MLVAILSLAASAATASPCLHCQSAATTRKSNASGVTYYVDPNGSDSNNGTSTSSAWKTVAKVNSIAFNPGDSVLFKCAGVWSDSSLTPTTNGTAAHPIKIGAYGTGAAPVIDAAYTVPTTAWKSYQGNIYVASVSVADGHQVYIDGTYLNPAHYPQSGLLTATTTSTTATTVTSNTMGLTSTQVVGTTVVARVSNWAWSTATATAYQSTSGTITVGSALRYDMPAGYGFYLRGALWMLTAPGGWYYDSVGKKLYMWTPNSDSPANHSVEITDNAYALNGPSRAYFNLNGVAFRYGGTANVSLDNDNSIQSVSSTGAPIGISVGTSSVVESSSINDALTYGIDNNGDNTLISKNTVVNAGNIGLEPDVAPAGIFSVGDAVTISGNSVSDSGYDGINFNGGINQITGNIVNSSLLRLDDGGGIYSYASSPSNTQVDSVISGNTVTNSIGNLTGTTATATLAAGIYLDNNRHDVEVELNTISNADLDIYFHDGWNNTAFENTAHLARRYAFEVTEDSGSGTVHNISATGNVFESSSLSPVIYYSTSEATSGFGSYNQNLYCHPAGSTAVNNEPDSVSSNYTLSSWQSYSSQDKLSLDSAVACPAATVVTGSVPALN